MSKGRIRSKYLRGRKSCACNYSGSRLHRALVKCIECLNSFARRMAG